MKMEQVMSASRDELISEIDRLRIALWNAGVCADCGEEIQHDITEPFSSCSCGTGEATVIPTIAQLRYELSGVPLLKEQVRVGDICSHYHMKRARLCEQANELANEMVQAMAGEIERAYRRPTSSEPPPARSQ